MPDREATEIPAVSTLPYTKLPSPTSRASNTVPVARLGDLVWSCQPSTTQTHDLTAQLSTSTIVAQTQSLCLTIDNQLRRVGRSRSALELSRFPS